MIPYQVSSVSLTSYNQPDILLLTSAPALPNPHHGCSLCMCMCVCWVLARRKWEHQPFLTWVAESLDDGLSTPLSPQTFWDRLHTQLLRLSRASSDVPTAGNLPRSWSPPGLGLWLEGSVTHPQAPERQWGPWYGVEEVSFWPSVPTPLIFFSGLDLVECVVQSHRTIH